MTNMKLVPYEKYEFTTLIPLEEAKKIIADNCERYTFGSIFGRSKKLFWGHTEGNKFKIYRAIKYGNSFLPILNGELIDNGVNTKVLTSLRMPIFTNIFMACWLSTALFGAIISAFKTEEPLFLVPLISFLFGYGLMQGGFWFEVPKAKRNLNKILKKIS